MKISELKEAIEEMRGIYKFSDEDTEIEIKDDIRVYERYVSVYVKDEETGVEITMRKRIKQWLQNQL